jgi:hypothetical protein
MYDYTNNYLEGLRKTSLPEGFVSSIMASANLICMMRGVLPPVVVVIQRLYHLSLINRNHYLHEARMNLRPIIFLISRSICLSMALQSFVGPWPLFQFLNPIHSRYDSLVGGSARRKDATYTQNNTNRE